MVERRTFRNVSLIIGSEILFALVAALTFQRDWTSAGTVASAVFGVFSVLLLLRLAAVRLVVTPDRVTVVNIYRTVRLLRPDVDRASVSSNRRGRACVVLSLRNGRQINVDALLATPLSRASEGILISAVNEVNGILGAPSA